MSSLKKRNGYIDVIKFFFALIIMDFHVDTGFFCGGRSAVEGFFMISGYLMMRSIRSNKNPQDSLGVSTVRFIYNKFKALLTYLLPATVIGYICACIIAERNADVIFERIPMLFFEIFPLQEAGFRGEYVLGISWYLSAMFLALAVLYPLCKKFGTTMTMIVCPIVSFLIYGALSYHYGDISIARTYYGDSFISSGLLRGIAACAAGCTLYEVCEALSKKKVTMVGRALFTLAEVLLLVYFVHTMHVHPKSRYDYLLIFVIFLMLTIGIGGISFSSYLLRGKFTKILGTASTLIVLTHYSLNLLFDYWFGDKYYLTDKYNLYLLVVALSCAAVWLMGAGLQKLAKKASVSLKPKIWAK